MAESRNVSAQGKDACPTTEILTNATKPNAEIRPGHSSSCTSTPQPDFFFQSPLIYVPAQLMRFFVSSAWSSQQTVVTSRHKSRVLCRLLPRYLPLFFRAWGFSDPAARQFSPKLARGGTRRIDKRHRPYLERDLTRTQGFGMGSTRRDKQATIHRPLLKSVPNSNAKMIFRRIPTKSSRFLAFRRSS